VPATFLALDVRSVDERAVVARRSSSDRAAGAEKAARALGFAAEIRHFATIRPALWR